MTLKNNAFGILKCPPSVKLQEEIEVLTCHMRVI